MTPVIHAHLSQLFLSMSNNSDPATLMCLEEEKQQNNAVSLKSNLKHKDDFMADGLF